MDPTIYNLNYKFQKQDHRDYMLTHEPETGSIKLKTKVGEKIIASEPILPKLNLYRINKPIIILNQGSIGSCVANAFAMNIACQTFNRNVISRLMVYALARIYDNTPLSDDAGTEVRSAAASIAKYGVCPERIYNYTTSNYSTLPPLVAFKSSNLFTSFVYTFVKQDLKSIQACLNTYKVPIIFGFFVYNAFLSSSVTKTGIVPMPLPNEKPIGGHCMNIVGYDDAKKLFICANSWGNLWGDKGYCYIPYDYLLNPNMACDFCYLTFK